MKKIIILLNFYLLQLFLFSYLSNNYLFYHYDNFELNGSLISVCFIIIILINFYIFLKLINILVNQKKEESNSILLESAHNLINSLRAKHHDFINHLQVILGFTQLDKKSDVINYIHELNTDLSQIEKLVTLKRPEIAALISSKSAKHSNFNFNIDITTNLAKLHISPTDSSSIFGNLLDNALYEVSLKDDKWLIIKISEAEDYYLFQITNPGTIPEDIRDKIFEARITSKKDKGTGMGLYIVKNIINKYGGVLLLDTSKDGEISFTAKLPKKKCAKSKAC